MKVSAADIRHLNFLHPRSLFCANFRIIVFALVPDQTYGTCDFLVALARPHERAQIMAGLREQAGVQLAIGRDSGARAGGTKGLRHAGDDADFAASTGSTC